jgi:hypothetical protein
MNSSAAGTLSGFSESSAGKIDLGMAEIRILKSIIVGSVNV